MPNRYSIFPASVVTGAGTVNFQQILSVGVRPAQDVDEVIPGGMLDRQASILNFADPRVVATTHDLLTAFTNMAPTDVLNCSSGATFRYQLRNKAGFASTGFTLTSTAGALYWSGISCAQDSPAVGSIEFCPLYDGTNEPLVSHLAVSFSGAPAPQFNSKYWMGGVYLGATPLDGLINVDVGFGMNFDTLRTDGSVFATDGSIVQRLPMIGLTFKKLDWVNTIGSVFSAALGSGIFVYYEKGLAGSGRVPAGTSGHIKLTAATGSWGADDVTVNDNGDATLTINVRPTGTLAVSTASTIP